MATYPIGQQAGIPRDFHVAGETFKVSGISFHQLATLQDRLREITPHPVDEARALLEKLGDLATEEDRRGIVQAATAKVTSGQWPPAFGGSESERYYYGTPDGVAYFLYTILRVHQSELTFEEVSRRIAPKVSVKDMDRLSVLIELVSEESLAARKAKELGVEPDDETAAVVGSIAPSHTEMESDHDPKA